MPQRNQIDVTSSQLVTFQRDNDAPDPGQVAARLAANGSLIGINAGLKTVQVVKAALAIASRASEAQLEQSGISAGRNPGVLKDAFERPTVDRNPPAFLGKLGKFIEPSYLRENLIDYSYANGTGYADPRITDAMQLDSQISNKNLAQEASYVMDHSTRAQIAYDNAQAKIRF